MGYGLVVEMNVREILEAKLMGYRDVGLKHSVEGIAKGDFKIDSTFLDLQSCNRNAGGV